jgi:hypothetical protein
VNNIILAINKGEVKLVFIEGNRNCSDMNTKSLDFLGFEECVRRLKTGYARKKLMLSCNLRKLTKSRK